MFHKLININYCFLNILFLILFCIRTNESYHRQNPNKIKRSNSYFENSVNGLVDNWLYKDYDHYDYQNIYPPQRKNKWDQQQYPYKSFQYPSTEISHIHFSLQDNNYMFPSKVLKRQVVVIFMRAVVKSVLVDKLRFQVSYN